MLYKTKGVVLTVINYNDKYMLVPIFTDLFGTITYMVSKARGKNTKVPRVLFSPLALLDLEVEHQPNREIQRVREAQSLLHLYGIATDMSKTAMAFFLSEFFTRVLKDTNDTLSLFDFLRQSIEILDKTENSVANFHLTTMLKLTRLMGFYPNLEGYAKHDIFDMIQGEFTNAQPLHNHFVNRTESIALARLSRISYENMHKFKFSRGERNMITDRILEYYRLHLYDFPQLKSLDVLHELF